MLQAYIDASGTGDPRAVVLAGYIATADTWDAFSKEWQARLDHAGLTRFKMNEIAPSRMEVAAFFYRVIEEYDIRAAVSCVLHTDAMRKVIGEYGLPNISNIGKLQNPYYLGFRTIVENVARDQTKLGFTEPIDFIFDDQSEARDLIDAWDLLKFAADPVIKSLLGDKPIFRPDEKVLPLQAADLYAWWVFRWFKEGDANAGVREMRFGWDARKKINRLHMEYDEEAFRAGVKDVEKRAEVLAAEAKIGRRGIVQEMSGGWARLDFNFEIRHVGFEPEFYGEDGAESEIHQATAAVYAAARDTARVFIQNRDGVAFSAAEMLAWFLEKTASKLEDYILSPEATKAIEEGKTVFEYAFPINFSRNSFHMRTTGGPIDLRGLTLMVEFTLMPKYRS